MRPEQRRGHCQRVAQDHALGVGLAEVLAGGLVLGQPPARPEQVNEAPVAGELFDRFFEGGDGAAADAEDVEEVVPEGLALGSLARFALPFTAECDSAVPNLIPRQWHGRRLPRVASQKTEVFLREPAGERGGYVNRFSASGGTR